MDGKTIIVPLDGSTEAERALDVALPLARAYAAPIVLLHVVEPSDPRIAQEDPASAERYLAAVAARLGPAARAEPRVGHGVPDAEILDAARGCPAPLIVIAAHGHGDDPRRAYGRVVDKVLRGAPGPVVVVPRGMSRWGGRLSRMLAPLDGSPLAEEALPLAVDLARRAGATLALLRVVEPYRPLRRLGAIPQIVPIDPELAADLTESAVDEARAYLEGLALRLRGGGIRVSWESRLGRARDEIVRAAETMPADLVVMSTHGRGGLRRWAFGSVTDDVLASTTVPTLVIPPLAQQAALAEMDRAAGRARDERSPALA